MVARLLQSAIHQAEGSHQVYLDDSLWSFYGTLARRNLLLAFVLVTMAALGLKVAFNKGERSNAVTWVGIRFALVDADTLVVTLPQKFMEELLGLLEELKGRGMAPVRALRVIAGKTSWLAGVLPRAKWTVAIFYAVIYSADDDSSSGKEELQRQARADSRKKEGLFAVKRVEQARLWLGEVIKVAMEQPIRLIKIGGSPMAVVTITTASPDRGPRHHTGGQCAGGLGEPGRTQGCRIAGLRIGDVSITG